MRGQLDARRAEMRALTARSCNTNRLDREVVAKLAEVSELREQRDELARRLALLRAAHGQRVVEALAPVRRESAARALGALGDVQRELRLLDEITVAAERNGGYVQRIAVPWFHSIEQALRQARDLLGRPPPSARQSRTLNANGVLSSRTAFRAQLISAAQSASSHRSWK